MDFQEKMAHDEEERTSVQKQTRYGWFPFAHILMLVWLCYIALMLVLLQLTVERGKVTADIPWVLSSLPGILLTGFAQAHLAITGVYLSRLGLGALQREGMQPRSWKELLWLAGSKWQSPVGILAVAVDSRKARQSISYTFVLFAATCLVATATPIVLSKGWPAYGTQVGTLTTANETSYLPGSVGTVDVTSRLGAGEGTWATGLKAKDVYGSIAFDPDASLQQGYPTVEALDAAWANTPDIFFAGSFGGDNVNVTGLRIQGGCSLNVTGDDAGSPNPPANFEDFQQTCHHTLDSVGAFDQANSTNLHNDLALWWCTDSGATLHQTDEQLSPPTPPTMALIWYNSTGYNDSVSVTGPDQTYILCNATFTEGAAIVSGMSGSFAQFNASASQDWGSSSNPFHPLDLLLLDIKQSFNMTRDPFGVQAANVRRALGFANLAISGEDSSWEPPPNYDFVANQLWQGVVHMTAAMTLLSSEIQLFNETQWDYANARIERRSFIVAGGTLLAIWFVLLVVCTVRLHGRTFGGSLDIYVAARQLSEGPQILHGQPFGSMSENARLREPYHFTAVDRA